MKIVAAGRQECGQEFIQGGYSPAAIAQGGATTEEEDAPAAPIDIFAQEFLLQWGEVIGINGTNNDARVLK